jgi:hypothetical protein
MGTRRSLRAIAAALALRRVALAALEALEANEGKTFPTAQAMASTKHRDDATHTKYLP